MKNLEIVGVAIFYNETLYTCPKPCRHHDVIRLIGGIYGPHVEGFVDASGKFLKRKEAYIRATQTGQINRRKGEQFYQGDELYSEDLW
jgi:hypothetical protein